MRALLDRIEPIARAGRTTLTGRSHWSPSSSRRVLELEMERTLALTPGAGIRGARYWSWKWIAGLTGGGGRPANAYAAAFLRDLRSP